MKLSVIIPVYHEEKNLKILLPYLRKHLDEGDEIFIVDAKSHDQSKETVQSQGEIWISCEEKCRAIQMNLGASHAKGDVYYFLHADAFPPPQFKHDILDGIKEGFPIGSYPFLFDSEKWYLKINSFFTRFNYLYFRGGDQSIYVTRSIFEKLSGFDPYYCIMEDFDFLQRARKIAPFKVMKGRIWVSARKYENNSYWKVNLANFKAVWMFKKGKEPAKIKKMYAQMLFQEVDRY